MGVENVDLFYLCYCDQGVIISWKQYGLMGLIFTGQKNDIYNQFGLYIPN